MAAIQTPTSSSACYFTCVNVCKGVGNKILRGLNTQKNTTSLSTLHIDPDTTAEESSDGSDDGSDYKLDVEETTRITSIMQLKLHHKGVLGCRQIPNTVSAYLSFADNADLNPRHLADALKMNSYVDHLQESGKSATSQHATLCRLKQGLSFHTLPRIR